MLTLTDCNCGKRSFIEIRQKTELIRVVMEVGLENRDYGSRGSAALTI
jgi:hypothetical protein